MPLLTRGRLSVQPVPEAAYEGVAELGRRGGWEELMGSAGAAKKAKKAKKVEQSGGKKRKAKEEDEDEEPERDGDAEADEEEEEVKPKAKKVKKTVDPPPRLKSRPSRSSSTRASTAT